MSQNIKNIHQRPPTSTMSTYSTVDSLDLSSLELCSSIMSSHSSQWDHVRTETEARLVSRSHNNSCNDQIQQQQLLNLNRNLHPNNCGGTFNFLSRSQLNAHDQLDRATNSINTQQQFQRVYPQVLATSATSLDDVKFVYTGTPGSTSDYYLPPSVDPSPDLSRFPISAPALPLDDCNFCAPPSSVRSSEWTTYQATTKQMAIAPRTPPESSGDYTTAIANYANASGVEYNVKDYWADMLHNLVSVDANPHSQQLMHPPLGLLN